jgi:adenosine deaminase
MNTDIAKIIRTIPKAELHIHIEGSLEPELIFALAKRNNIPLPYADIESLRAAYAFHNLQSFLDIYYAGASVLIQEQDFYDMTMAYLERAHADNVIHTEIFFDPQTHTERGIAIDTVIHGLYRACQDAKAKWGINALLILCFLRHMSEQSAIDTWDAAMPFKDKLVGVGLDSSEVGHPPEKFTHVFALCKAAGMRLVAHAGEEGPPAYIWQALDVLKVERIDHGVRCLEDADLVARLAQERIPLTVCPLSNLKLKVVSDMEQHPLKTMLDAGLCVTINSDDPAYFGGYMNTNWEATFAALDLTVADALTLARNSFEAAFVDEATRRGYLAQLTTHVAAHSPN